MSEENDVEEKTIVFIPPPWPEYLDLAAESKSHRRFLP